jgi:hypothetical protein
LRKSNSKEDLYYKSIDETLEQYESAEKDANK